MGSGYTDAFDGTLPAGGNVGSANSQDLFAGYGTGFMNEQQFVLDISERIHLLNPAATPFFSWMSMIDKRPAHNIEFSWTEDELFLIRDFNATLVRDADGSDLVYALRIDPQDWHAIEAAAYADTPSATKPSIFMTVTDVATGAVTFSCVIERNGVIQGPITRTILDQDGAAAGIGTVKDHIVIATYDDSETELAMGTSAAWTGHEAEVNNCPANVGTGDFDQTDWGDATTAVRVHITTPNEFLGGFPQGSGLPNESRKRTRTLTNVTQIFKTPYSIANTLKSVRLYGGPELARLRLRKVTEHKVDIERAIVFQGGGTYGTDWGILPGTAENPKTQFKGLGVGQTSNYGWIYTKNGDRSSDFQLSASADADAVIDLLDAVFDDTVDDPSSVKVCFASNKWMNTLAKIAAQRDNGGFIFGGAGVEENALGFSVVNLTGPAGTLRFVRYPHFRGQFEDYALAVDFSRMAVRPLPGRDTQLHANVGGGDIDGQLDYYQTELGFELKQESTHAILKLA